MNTTEKNCHKMNTQKYDQKKGFDDENIYVKNYETF